MWKPEHCPAADRHGLRCPSDLTLLVSSKKPCTLPPDTFCDPASRQRRSADDRGRQPVVRLFPRSNCPRRGQAIHDRHLPVHQDKVIVSSYKPFEGDGPFSAISTLN